jgi:hypothetical protein
MFRPFHPSLWSPWQESNRTSCKRVAREKGPYQITAWEDRRGLVKEKSSGNEVNLVEYLIFWSLEEGVPEKVLEPFQDRRCMLVEWIYSSVYSILKHWGTVYLFSQILSTCSDIMSFSFLIWIVGGGVESNWLHSALRPQIGLLCQPRVIMMMEKLVEWWLARETEVLGENLPRYCFVHHKPHMLCPDANPGRRGGKPATNRWAMTRPYNELRIILEVITGRTSEV